MSSKSSLTFKEYLLDINEKDDTVGKKVEKSYSKRLDKKYVGKARSKMTTKTPNNVMYGGGGFLPTSGGNGNVSGGSE